MINELAKRCKIATKAYDGKPLSTITLLKRLNYQKRREKYENEKLFS